MSNMWGIHNDTLTTELVDQGFVSLGWDDLGDLTQFGGRDQLKVELTAKRPDAKPMAVANWAGNLHRFAYEMQQGDVVVAPYKPDGTINIGIITGPYRYEASAPTHRHRRDVSWKKTGISRATFTQPALYEIGSLLAVFGIRKHADEFNAVLQSSADPVTAVATVTEREGEEASEESSDEPRASRVARHTRDYVLATSWNG